MFTESAKGIFLKALTQPKLRSYLNEDPDLLTWLEPGVIRSRAMDSQST